VKTETAYLAQSPMENGEQCEKKAFPLCDHSDLSVMKRSDCACRIALLKAGFEQLLLYTKL